MKTNLRNYETERDREVRARLRVGMVVILAPQPNQESAYEVERLGPKMLFLRCWSGPYKFLGAEWLSNIRRPRKVTEIYEDWEDFVTKNPGRLERDVPPREEW